MFPKELPKKVKVCKIDVEGYEKYVLEGMEEVMHELKQCVFVMEMTPVPIGSKRDIEKIYAFFKKHGFTYKVGDKGGEKQYEEIFFSSLQAGVL